ncbi:hypothetical protein CK203_039654 [Vitis vinifera]|uniref:Uncharacterized protein n=1 Tax=Vitis vinifera TaxID=29760 RepID=A0A438HFN9_VITVI|nr:hypothetical protein CK203_039654 [Vitis vinifera]
MELGRNLDWTDEVRESAPSGWQIINKGISTLQSQSEAKKLQKWSPDHKKYRRRLQKKLQKEKLSGSRLVMKFLSSPGGIEGTSRLIPFFFMQHRYPKMNVSSTCFWYSASSSSLSAANSRSSSSFCATKRSCKSSSVSFHRNFCPELPHLPLSRAISSAASCSGRC